MEHIRIAIVEDQQLFRQSLSALIRTFENHDLVFETDQGTVFLDYLAGTFLRPHIVLMDMNMPGMNGLELNTILHRDYPGIKVIVLSVHAQERIIAKMIQAGACAYLNKNCDAEELITAIGQVHRTGLYISNQVLAAIQNATNYKTTTIKNVDKVPVELTKREMEILQLLCQECSTTEIAEKLFISIRTVEGHRNNLLLKTGCRNSAGLVLFAVRNRIVEILF
jgi:DNA-binding NarL/FixJ family response regulator